MALIVGGAGAALLLAATTGVAVALLFGGDDENDEPPPPSPSPDVVVTPSPSPDVVVTPSPSPDVVVTPSPTFSPTPTPTPSPDGGDAEPQIVDVENIALQVPADWEVKASEPDYIRVQDPQSGGLLIVESRTASQAFTADQLQQALVNITLETSPDAEVCRGPEPAGVPRGPADGRYFVLCYTITPQGGQALPVYDLYLVGVQGDSYFIWNLFAIQERMDALIDRVGSTDVRWKLFAG